MRVKRFIFRLGLLVTVCAALSLTTAVRAQSGDGADEEFGPVVRAYLGYLRAEQEVVDDRGSRHEISPRYYRRNMNRIRALRQMAISIARETGNDYLPELEATTRDEFGTLFETPPDPRTFNVGEILGNRFRYLGSVRAGETFYIFARLDPYEQAELMKRAEEANPTSSATTAPPAATPPDATPVATSGDKATRRRDRSGSPR